MTLIPHWMRPYHIGAGIGVQGDAPSLLSVHISNVVGVLLIEHIDRNPLREIRLEQHQTVLKTQSDASQKATQLLASIVVEMVASGQVLQQLHHAQREGLSGQLRFTADDVSTWGIFFQLKEDETMTSFCRNYTLSKVWDPTMFVICFRESAKRGSENRY